MTTKSSSSQRSSSTTVQIDERIAAADNAVVVKLEEGASFDFVDISGEAVSDVLDFASGIVAGGADFLGSQLEQERGLARELVESESRSTSRDVLQLVAVVAVVGAAAVAAPKLVKAFRG